MGAARTGSERGAATAGDHPAGHGPGVWSCKRGRAARAGRPRLASAARGTTAESACGQCGPTPGAAAVAQCDLDRAAQRVVAVPAAGVGTRRICAGRRVPGPPPPTMITSGRAPAAAPGYSDRPCGFNSRPVTPTLLGRMRLDDATYLSRSGKSIGAGVDIADEHGYCFSRSKRLPGTLRRASWMQLSWFGTGIASVAGFCRQAVVMAAAPVAEKVARSDQGWPAVMD